VFRILLTVRWLVLTVILAALIPTFYELGMWQYHRYEQTKRNNALIDGNLAAKPVAFDRISRPGGSIPGRELYRTVTATGTYDAAGTFVVRQRTDASGDNLGYYVVTPLDLANGQVVLVNRGWVKPNNLDGNAYPTAAPRTPGGTVTVTGRLRPDETPASTGIRQRKGLPAREYMLINSTEQAARLHRPVDAGYLELVSTSPNLPAADQAELVPNPNDNNSDSMAVVGKGVHLPYAIQWWLFTAMVPVAWFVLFRREVKEQRNRAASAATAAAPSPAAPASPAPAPDGAAPSAPASPAPGAPSEEGTAAAGVRE